MASHRIVGKSVSRGDIPSKVFGGASYVQDLRLPNMAHGRVVRPPRPGSTMESVDEGAVRALPGVVAVVRDGSFLGVVAEREEQAIKAREALIKSAKWKLGPELPDPAKLYAHLKTSLSALASSARSGNTPCEWVHTVICPSADCATAHEGPIEACAMYGLV